MIILKVYIKQSDIEKREAQVRIMTRIYILTRRRWLRGSNAMIEEINVGLRIGQNVNTLWNNPIQVCIAYFNSQCCIHIYFLYNRSRFLEFLCRLPLISERGFWKKSTVTTRSTSQGLEIDTFICFLPGLWLRPVWIIQEHALGFCISSGDVCFEGIRGYEWGILIYWLLLLLESYLL